MRPAAARILRSARLHPFLFAIYPVLFFWGRNATEGRLHEALLVALISAAIAAFAMVVLDRLVFRSREKAAVATSVGLLVFFSWGRVYSVVYGTGLAIGRQRFLLPLFGALLLLFWLWLARRPEATSGRSLVLNCAGGLLVVFAGCGFLLESWTWMPPATVVEDEWAERMRDVEAERPDVYYIVLDGYGRGDVLAEDFDFDNEDFLDGLRRRGFVVADRSRANYSWTLLSLASSLNFDLLHGPDGLLRGRRPESRRLRGLVRDNRLFRLLGLAGYSRYVIGRREDFLPSSDPPETIVECGASREMVEAFLETTVARVWRHRWSDFTAERRRSIARCQFRALEEVVSEPGPKLVFFHSLVTHPPFLFHADGSPRPVEDALTRKWRPWRPHGHYVDQIVLVNRVLDAVVDRILERSESAVIVIQGDHGPGGSRNWGEDRAGAYRERFGILNAVRMPEADDRIYPGITPANTFRVFFREYLGLPVDELEDVSFARDAGSGAFVDVRGLLEPRDTKATPSCPR